MQITRFKVSGYKNFTEEVELKDLSRFTILHGPNNVGKSNLLEAMGLPFVLLGVAPEFPFGRSLRLLRKTLEEAKYPTHDLFNLRRPGPVEIEIELSLSPEEWASSGAAAPDADASTPRSPVVFHFTIDPGPPHLSWVVHRFHFGDGTDAVQDRDGQVQTRAKKLASFLAENYLVGGGGGQRRFQVVASAAGMGSREGVPPELCLSLYDHQESANQSEYERWALFSDLMQRFTDVTGATGVRAIYNRKNDIADLVFQMDGYRMPVRLLGTGIQQLVVLLGSLVTNGAQIVGVEEPEANLSFALQLRLREVLRELVHDPRGPSQLFLTSHSPGFQVGPSFFFLRPQPTGGPSIHRQPAKLSYQLTGFQTVLEPAEGDSAPISWVTPEGLLQLPPSVIGGLGLEHGGGVGFLPADPGFQLLSNAQAIQELGLDPTDD